MSDGQSNPYGCCMNKILAWLSLNLSVSFLT